VAKAVPIPLKKWNQEPSVADQPEEQRRAEQEDALWQIQEREQRRDSEQAKAEIIEHQSDGLIRTAR